MANPFYARYIPPKLNVVGRADSDSNLDESQSIKRRKTDLGFKSIVDAVEEKAGITIGTPHSEVKISHGPQLKVDKPKKEKKEKNQKKKKPAADINSQNITSEISDSGLTAATPKTKRVINPVEDRNDRPKKEKPKHAKEKNNAASIEKEMNVNLVFQESTDSHQENVHKKIRARYKKSAESAPIQEGEESSKDENSKEVEAEPVELHGLEPLPQPVQLPEPTVKLTFSALPDWIGKPMIISPLSSAPLDSLNLNSGILASLKKKGYHDAFAIQAAVLRLLLPGPEQHQGDICISAATGSGKTLAYTLPMVEELRDKPLTRLRGLVVVPTRELVRQVRESLEMCSAGSGVKIGTAVGSKSLKEEQELLIEIGQRFDPDAYLAEKVNALDEDEQRLDWDFDSRAEYEEEFDIPRNYVVAYNSKVDILICTPGRIVDHIRSTKGFTLDHVQWLVIDEADRLLDEGFQQWIEIVIPALEVQRNLNPIEERLFKTFDQLPGRKVQKILLSATMTRDISKLQALKLHRPKLVALETSKPESTESQPVQNETQFELPSNLKELAIPIENSEDKPLHLIEVLQNNPTLKQSEQARKLDADVSLDESSNDSSSESDSSLTSSSGSGSSSPSSTSIPPSFNPRPAASLHGSLIFTNNNENALRLARLLTLLRPSWQPQISTLTKSTTTSAGRRALSSFRAGKTCILIASDRASRGLDIPDLAEVINYDMPTSVTNYVHRVGRTARAGREGKAITLVARHEARWFWNDIARGKVVVRGQGGKVRRGESKLENWGKEERRSYDEALRTLGEEAKGGEKVRIFTNNMGNAG